MRVHLIRKETLQQYMITHARTKTSLEDWLEKIRYADWNRPTDIQNTFPTADVLGNGSERVVFNIAGNIHRMICKYAFGDRQVHLFVCWLGTHAEYDAICRSREQFTIQIY